MILAGLKEIVDNAKERTLELMKVSKDEIES